MIKTPDPEAAFPWNTESIDESSNNIIYDLRFVCNKKNGFYDEVSKLSESKESVLKIIEQKINEIGDIRTDDNHKIIDEPLSALKLAHICLSNLEIPKIPDAEYFQEIVEHFSNVVLTLRSVQKRTEIQLKTNVIPS